MMTHSDQSLIYRGDLMPWETLPGQPLSSCRWQIEIQNEVKSKISRAWQLDNSAFEAMVFMEPMLTQVPNAKCVLNLTLVLPWSNLCRSQTHLSLFAFVSC